jgi:predicted phage terminase large subunit-like protein
LTAEPMWSCLRLPAIAEKDDVLGRQQGQVLWPEWQDEAAIARRRREVGERSFAAMYQQNPRPADAALFKVDNIKVVVEVPAVTRTIRAWDLAGSLPVAGRNPDYTVGVKLGVTAENRLIILDVIRFQGSPAQVEARIQATAKVDGVSTILTLPQDPGQAGAAQVAMLSRSLAGFHVVATPETGAKITRAMPAATQVDAGNLALVSAPWNDSFLAELRAFPDSAKDDQVDALSRAVNTLVTTNTQMSRRINVPFLNR